MLRSRVRSTDRPGSGCQATVTEREACKTMVGLLVLAAEGHEAQLADELEQLIEIDQLPDLHALSELLAPPVARFLSDRGITVAGRLRPTAGGRAVSAATNAADGRLGADAERTATAHDQATWLPICAPSRIAKVGLGGA